MKYFARFKFVSMALVLGFFTASQLKADDGAGWYMKGDIGPAFTESFNTAVTSSLFAVPSTTTKSAFRSGIRTDLDGGYEFNQCWAVEAELGYIYNSPDTAASTGPNAPLHQMPFLINGIYTIPLKWPVKPYVGAGVGTVVSWWNTFYDVNAAGQIMAGVKYDLNKNIDLALSYKLLLTTDHDWNNVLTTEKSGGTITHSIVASVTYKF